MFPPRGGAAMTVVPLLLAAGASSRMGRPKALLDFDGRTTLALALEAMAGFGPPIVVLGPNRAEIEARVNLSGARVVVNPDVASGQTASLRAGLALLSPDAEAFVFMPVDYPLVRRSDVARLVEAAGAAPSKAVFIPSHAMRRGHPVLCRRALAAEILALPPETPARAALHADPARVEHVFFEEADILMEMNTPEDYARCLQAFRARERRT
jgi:molybdenum cofactor cytidylyltransferase